MGDSAQLSAPQDIKMDQFIAQATSLSADLEPFAGTAAKIAIPLGCLYVAGKALGTVWRRLLGPLLVGEVKWKEMGSWAVIAGASYGIGAEYARELAKRGMNVFIIGHDEAGLKDVEMSIKQRFNVKVKMLVADFSDGMVGFNAVRDAIQDLDIGVLVNTAAIDLPFGSFDMCDGADMKKLIDVNCGTPTVMMSIVLPKMLRKRRGII